LFIKTITNKKTGITNVYLVEGYRDINNAVKHRTIKSYGRLDILKKQDPNILIKLRSEAKNTTNNGIVNLSFNIKSTANERKKSFNYGYYFLEAIYKKLEIDKFLFFKSNNYKFEYNLNDIMKLLVFSRILNPASKLRTWENQKCFFEPFNTEYGDIIRSLNVINDIKEDLQLHIHKNITNIYGRDTTLMFYDVTNYYFEKDYEDSDILNDETGEVKEGFRKKGMCKANTRNPLVVMGLLIDSNGIPVAYKLFKGNTSDYKTLIPILSELKEKYKIDRIITTADKGLNSGNNLAYMVLNGDGYIVSQKIRGSKKNFIEIVLNQEGYIFNKKKTHKSKSITREREMSFTGYFNKEYVKDKKVKLKEKVVIFWSKDYDERMKYKRKEIMKKIEEYKKNPKAFKASNTYGIKRYFKTKQVDKKTGEEIKGRTKIIFDEEKYNRDIALDGYYAIVTSEVNLTDEEIISKYRGLIDIEDAFRIIKSDLEGRPIYVRCEENIEGHFLICFIALIISRLLLNYLNKGKKKEETKISIDRLKEALNSARVKNLGKNIYEFEETSDLVREIEERFNVDGDFAQIPIEQFKKYVKSIFDNI